MQQMGGSTREGRTGPASEQVERGVGLIVSASMKIERAGNTVMTNSAGGSLPGRENIVAGRVFARVEFSFTETWDAAIATLRAELGDDGHRLIRVNKRSLFPAAQVRERSLNNRLYSVTLSCECSGKPRDTKKVEGIRHQRLRNSKKTDCMFKIVCLWSLNDPAPRITQVDLCHNHAPPAPRDKGLVSLKELNCMTQQIKELTDEGLDVQDMYWFLESRGKKLGKDGKQKVRNMVRTHWRALYTKPKDNIDSSHRLQQQQKTSNAPRSDEASLDGPVADVESTKKVGNCDLLLGTTVMETPTSETEYHAARRAMLHADWEALGKELGSEASKQCISVELSNSIKEDVLRLFKNCLLRAGGHLAARNELYQGGDGKAGGGEWSGSTRRGEDTQQDDPSSYAGSGALTFNSTTGSTTYQGSHVSVARDTSGSVAVRGWRGSLTRRADGTLLGDPSIHAGFGNTTPTSTAATVLQQRSVASFSSGMERGGRTNNGP
ncbi:unnamed protein product [Choristocarpus tenellus]